MKIDERDTLRYIRKNYGEMIERAALRFWVKPELIAAIMCRETAGGLSPLLDKPGPEGRGDEDSIGVRHGLGLMQIDDRWHKEFAASGKWKDAQENIMKGACILSENKQILRRIAAKRRFAIQEVDIERATVASYNAGPSVVVTALQRGIDVDSVTTGGDYSSHVEKLAALYRNILLENDTT